MFDQPVMIIAIGAAVVSLSIAVWWQMRTTVTFGFVVASLLVAGVVLAVERAVETPREQIAATLQEIEHALESNDLLAVQRYVLPSAREVHQDAKRWMRRIDIAAVGIKPNLKVSTNDRDADTVEARFNVVVAAYPKSGTGGPYRAARFLIVQFRRHEDEWRVQHYEVRDPLRRK